MWQLAVKYPIEAAATFFTILPVMAFLIRTAHAQRAVRFFFMYLVFKLIIELLMFYMASKRIDNLYLGNIFTIAGFFMIAKMFDEVFESPAKIIAVKCICLAFAFISAFDILRDGMQYTFRYTGFAECVFVVVFVLMYFHDLVLHPKVPYLLTHGFFWICAALLIFFAPSAFITIIEFYVNRWDADPSWQSLTLIPFILELPFSVMVGVGIFLKS